MPKTRFIHIILLQEFAGCSPDPAPICQDSGDRGESGRTVCRGGMCQNRHPQGYPSESMTETGFRAYSACRTVAAVANRRSPRSITRTGWQWISRLSHDDIRSSGIKRFDTLSQAMDGYMESLAESESRPTSTRRSRGYAEGEAAGDHRRVQG